MQLNVLVAPDKFKGTLSAEEVSDFLRQGIESAGVDAVVRSIPIADGGDGTLAVAASVGFEIVSVPSAGPLGEAREAPIAIRGREAVIELAAICGLQLLPPGSFEPERCTTLGVGLAVRAALDRDCRRITLGLGGSSSTDGGAGLLNGLGAVFYDEHHRLLAPNPSELRQLHTADLSALDARLREADMVMAVDVDSPLLGPSGSAEVFAPQKGADSESVLRLERGLRHWASVLTRIIPDLDASAPGSGAAGGVGFVGPALNASLRSGAEILLDLTGFGEALQWANLVITGEGRLDEQTLMGKGPSIIARRAAAVGVPTVAVVGSRTPSLTDAVLRQNGFDGIYALIDENAQVENDVNSSRNALRAIGARIARSYAVRARGQAQARTGSS